MASVSAGVASMSSRTLVRRTSQPALKIMTPTIAPPTESTTGKPMKNPPMPKIATRDDSESVRWCHAFASKMGLRVAFATRMVRRKMTSLDSTDTIDTASATSICSIARSAPCSRWSTEWDRMPTPDVSSMADTATAASVSTLPRPNGKRVVASRCEMCRDTRVIKSDTLSVMVCTASASMEDELEMYPATPLPTDRARLRANPAQVTMRADFEFFNLRASRRPCSWL
mmetsp:Transcript_8029/g.20250  ORF Transcript_8029/g.20250 Transcript_8029/m.20250 type:complete len:228 (+) Transcript_8029:2-685(+)